MTFFFFFVCFFWLPASFASLLLLLCRLLSRGPWRCRFLLSWGHHATGGGRGRAGRRARSRGGRGAAGCFTGIPEEEEERWRSENSKTAGVIPPLMLFLFQLFRLLPRLLSSQVIKNTGVLLTARPKLPPSPPVFLFLFAPSSSPSSCLCSTCAPSWAATSPGRASLWGRSSWGVYLRRKRWDERRE